jgi:hypothetical protein
VEIIAGSAADQAARPMSALVLARLHVCQGAVCQERKPAIKRAGDTMEGHRSEVWWLNDFMPPLGRPYLLTAAGARPNGKSSCVYRRPSLRKVSNQVVERSVFCHQDFYFVGSRECETQTVGAGTLKHYLKFGEYRGIVCELKRVPRLDVD